MLTRCLLIALGMYCYTVPVRADIVFLNDSVVYGRVRTSNAQTLVIGEGCAGKPQRSIDRSLVRHIKFTHECSPGNAMAPSAGMLVCNNDERVEGYDVTLSNGTAFFGSEYQITEDGRIMVELAMKTGSVTGPTASVTSITKRAHCKSTISNVESSTMPEGFCLETAQWAVNWSNDPVRRNQILRRGASVFVEGVGKPRATSEALNVREAFGYALTLWISALHKERTRLSAPLRTYLDSIFSCGTSGGPCLLTPPQVVENRCAGTSQFVIREFFVRDSIFPETDRDFAAKAQFEGRTIALNLNDFQFKDEFKKKLSLTTGGSDQVSLITILTHELGHALGLGHAAAGIESIMSDEYNLLPDEPSSADAMELAKVLDKDIQGLPAGKLNSETCAGLKVQRKRSTP